jgi:hypothetical protein
LNSFSVTGWIDSRLPFLKSTMFCSSLSSRNSASETWRANFCLNLTLTQYQIGSAGVDFGS